MKVGKVILRFDSVWFLSSLLNRCVCVEADMNCVFQELKVSKHLEELRNQRMLMVQTLSQYTFVYKVLIEYIRNSRLI